MRSLTRHLITVPNPLAPTASMTFAAPNGEQAGPWWHCSTAHIRLMRVGEMAGNLEGVFAVEYRPLLTPEGGRPLEEELVFNIEELGTYRYCSVVLSLVNTIFPRGVDLSPADLNEEQWAGQVEMLTETSKSNGIISVRRIWSADSCAKGLWTHLVMTSALGSLLTIKCHAPVSSLKHLIYKLLSGIVDIWTSDEADFVCDRRRMTLVSAALDVRYKLLLHAKSPSSTPSLRFEAALGATETEAFCLKVFNANEHAQFDCSVEGTLRAHFQAPRKVRGQS